MSAELLSRAAALMRERAEAALGPDFEWAVAEDADGSATWWAFTDEDRMCANGILTVRDLPQWTDRLTLWEHITGWPPAVALAVADWLDREAAWEERGATLAGDRFQALAVARAYLGESA